MKKLTMGGFILTTVAITAGSMFYPEVFALVLGGVVFGFSFGVFGATVIMESYYIKGAETTSKIQQKQVSNPAAIMREQRLYDQQQSRSKQPKDVNIPQFSADIDIKGLDIN